ncbi:MAG: rod shape-determining protein MreC [Bacteroidales bacterium]|jgi:rod shape-determining protein MreC|nr:rod shape-determining protein MreC [Bacteroidales bacterium]
MRTLFRFFYRHYMFFLFFLLEGTAFIMLLQQHYIQRITVGQFSGYAIGMIDERISRWRKYLNLAEINRQLVQENQELRSRLPGAYYSSDSTGHAVYDTLRQAWYGYLPANVVNISVNKQYNYITLDKGRRQHVKSGMPVVGSVGIAGIVDNVSEHFSTVLPVINRNFRLSVKFLKNDFYGSLQWNGQSYRYAELNEIPLHVPVAVGDTLVVTGYSSSFPEGAPVGTVSRFSRKDGNFYTIEVLLFTDYRKLYRVYLVKNYLKDEQDRLEQQKNYDEQ